MELGDYGRLLRRWWAFLLACTMVAGALGYYLAQRSSSHGHKVYDATATVLIAYSTPNGVAYNPTFSKQDVTVALSDRVKDPNVVQAVRNRFQIDQRAVSSVTSSVALDAPLITIHALGTDPTVAETFATGMAEELARLHTQQLTIQTAALRRQQQGKVTQARDKYLSMQREYYHVCGCIGGQSRPLVGQSVLENFQADLALLQQDWQSTVSDYRAIYLGPAPAAVASPGSASAVSTSSGLLKTVLPAAILGLLLAIVLAALIDYIRDLPFFVRKRTLQAEGPVVVSIEFKLRQRTSKPAAEEVSAAPESLSDEEGHFSDHQVRLASGDSR